jgi:peptide deformylase/SAM-dependent methyltransferase
VEGRVLEVVRAPAAVLSEPGEVVDPTRPEVVQLAADLVATMRVSPGCVGLAAPQVGVSAKVFCVDVSGHPKTRTSHGAFVLCNAEVVSASRNEKAREGCMSVPDLTGDVKRATRVVVPAPAPRWSSRPTPSRRAPSSTRSTTATACSSSTAPRARTRSTRAGPICEDWPSGTLGRMEESQLAAYFDDWYADMRNSPAKDEIEQRHLGLLAHVLSTSLLTWDGLAEVSAALDLSAGDVLLDLACGRGGYGLEVAARTGARHLGMDFSAEAVRQATEYAARLGRAADFRVGDLAETGLEDSSVDGVMVIDSIQFAPDPAAAYAEIRRVLRPGAPVVLTGWEARDPLDEEVPERLRRVDLEAGLKAAGFGSVHVEDRADWRAVERGLWEEAAALDPGDDPALVSFHDEGVRSLAIWDALRRVRGTATA